MAEQTRMSRRTLLRIGDAGTAFGAPPLRPDSIPSHDGRRNPTQPKPNRGSPERTSHVHS